MKAQKLVNALRLRADSLQREFDSGAINPDTVRDFREFAQILARVLEGMPIEKVFGAPGDWGYGTPIGDGLFEFLSARESSAGRDPSETGAYFTREMLQDVVLSPVQAARFKAESTGVLWLHSDGRTMFQLLRNPPRGEASASERGPAGGLPRAVSQTRPPTHCDQCSPDFKCWDGVSLCAKGPMD